MYTQYRTARRVRYRYRTFWASTYGRKYCMIYGVRGARDAPRLRHLWRRDGSRDAGLRRREDAPPAARSQRLHQGDHRPSHAHMHRTSQAASTLTTQLRPGPLLPHPHDSHTLTRHTYVDDTRKKRWLPLSLTQYLRHSMHHIVTSTHLLTTETAAWRSWDRQTHVETHPIQPERVHVCTPGTYSLR